MSTAATDRAGASSGPRTSATPPAPRFALVSLGAAPLLALVASVGLILIALGNNAARDDADLQQLFWVGLVLIFAPIAFRLFSVSAGRSERIALVLTLGVSLFLVKVLNSPAEFLRFDEFGWWRAANEVLMTGHSFNSNPLNPATAGFPGLATLTAAISQLTGLSIFHSGVIVVGVARATFVVALFIFLERITGSSRGAGVGVAIYACNPSFVFFDAQFGYESLALMLAAVLLLACVSWAELDKRAGDSKSIGIGTVVVLLICGLTVTHHMTSVAMVAFLAVWSGVRAVLGGSRAERYTSKGPYLPALLLTAAVAIWFITVAGAVTVDELGGLFSRAFDSVSDLILGRSSSKELFTGAGQQEGTAARALAALSLVASLGLVIGGLVAIWRSRARDPLWLALAAVGAAYPVTLALRLTQASSETSQRASAFVFLGVAFLTALIIVRWGRPARTTAVAIAVTSVATLSFAGSVVLGELKATRLPGSYLVGAENRSVSPEGVAAARFVAANLPSGSRLLTDRTNATLLGAYGEADPIFGEFEGIALPRILFDRTFDTNARRALRGQSLSFIVVDRRLSRARPLIGYYIESDEPGAFVRGDPVEAAALAKFASVTGVNKIYTNGPIVIYDTSALLR